MDKFIQKHATRINYDNETVITLENIRGKIQLLAKEPDNLYLINLFSEKLKTVPTKQIIEHLEKL